MELKGVEKVNKFLTEWLYAHGFEIEAEMGDSFRINLGLNVLEWSPYYDEDSAVVFFEEVQKDYPDFISCPDELLAFFHEIGHAETECEWDDEDWEEYDIFVENCHDDRTYFRHPIEWTATAWGCEYILNHKEEVAKFWKDFCKVMIEFFELNEVEQ